MSKCILYVVKWFGDGVPGEIRTPDRTLRRRMLYPAELLGQFQFFKDKLYYISHIFKSQQVFLKRG